jgi:CRISPR/Cas system-associated exonuclease Cas4 (RecB family)
MSQNNQSDDIIRASEIGEYVHCERAWWLGRVQGVENANRAVMEAGTERHRAHGQRVWRATMMQYGAMILFLIAVGAMILLVLRMLKLF